MGTPSQEQQARVCDVSLGNHPLHGLVLIKNEMPGNEHLVLGVWILFGWSESQAIVLGDFTDFFEREIGRIGYDAYGKAFL